MASQQNRKYTVGWICALPLEMAAARLMLDETHGKPQEQHPSDQNIYHLGSIGEHNIAIACLPAGVYGTTSAAIVAAQMLSSFESIRIGLMVGIGGGIPSKDHDIRLGDVAVSRPEKGSGGVIQYDFGKTVREGEFIRTGSLNKPPPVLLNAVANLQAEHEMEDSKIPEILSERLAKYKKMQAEYSHQGIANDQLYRADYEHEDDGVTCELCDSDMIVPRPERDTIDPCIHYGVIASGNQVIKNGVTRDWFRKELGAICFEMEAAGLMDNFPCLVIRGICDYADSHKNKRWQRYAAAVAAAYARELLGIIPASEVDPTPAAVEFMKTVHDQNKVIINTTQKIHQKIDLAKLRSVEGAAFDSFLNKTDDTRCHPDTRVGLLHEINEWFQNPQGKAIFWLNGMAGTGKSTLSRTVAQSFANKNQLGASFFFKRGEGDLSHAGRFFSTIATQLVVKIPALVPYVAKALDSDPTISEKPITEQFSKLIFHPLSNMELNPQKISKLAIVVDALDEYKTITDGFTPIVYYHRIGLVKPTSKP
ncbi:hypothetical protein ABW20_dc0107041 [Dactylellina cionopaga]|nr:hypothetical protein ABW20_dc0107041 [Dactylellina cionopaga]